MQLEQLSLYIFLIYLDQKFRNIYPKAKTLIEVIRIKFGNKLYKLILFLSIFYMIIFLIAEVTAVSILLKYIFELVCGLQH